MNPNVSILIPCFNSARWIREAIESALAQTHAPLEVIVIDDGSTDRSLDIIREFEGRIRWESQPNRGGNPTRNRLLELARGEWLQYLDSDDCLLPDKIARQVADVSTLSAADVIYSPSIMEYHSSTGTHREVLPIPEPHDPWLLLARWFLPQTGAALWRKQAIVDVGGWKSDQPACQEHELYLRLLQAGKEFRFIDAPGAIYRQWSEGTVCKRDVPETQRRRLAILSDLESHLTEHGGITLSRLDAINLSRFEIARSEWPRDHDWAARLVGEVESKSPGFVPAGRAFPTPWRMVYRLFGFRAAETIAGWKRSLAR